ncbi:MAG: proton-conducting transporter membrane subunit [Bacteroidales bacterium]|jgi:hydrogenase-4 component F|nr:proton-conducting transporter membrane subunit [Bacteroidales bacterium]
MLLGLYFIAGFILSGLLFLLKRWRSSVVITLLFILLQIFVSISAMFRLDEVNLNYFTFDSLAVIFLLILSLIASATLYHSVRLTRNATNWNRSLYFFSFIILNISLTGVFTANNIIVSWIFIELTTLSVASLINYQRTEHSLEATWKYVFVCSLGIALAYIGILFASATTGAGASGDMSFDGLKNSFVNINPVYLKMAFILILAGYSSKLEVFPLYTIGIDANYVAPSPVSAFLSTALVNGGFVAFYRVFSAMSDTLISAWMNHVMLITGLLSLLVASIYVQRSINLKRVFAYSTVEHMGLVLIALSLGKPGIYIALLQITFHSLIKSGIFYHMGILHRIMRSYQLDITGGYLKVNPTGAAIVLSGVILITAIPPSPLFRSEFLLMRELIDGQLIAFILTIMFLTLILYGILRKSMGMLLGESGQLKPSEENIAGSEYLFQLLFFLAAVVMCFYIPDFLNSLFNSASEAGGFMFESSGSI